MKQIGVRILAVEVVLIGFGLFVWLPDSTIGVSGVIAACLVLIAFGPTLSAYLGQRKAAGDTKIGFWISIGLALLSAVAFLATTALAARNLSAWKPAATLFIAAALGAHVVWRRWLSLRD